MAAVLEIPEGNPEKAIEHISGLGFRTREGILLKPLYDTITGATSSTGTWLENNPSANL